MKVFQNLELKFKDFLKILPGIGVAAVIFYFSSLTNPYPPPPSSITYLIDLNSLLHIVEFALFSFLITFGLLDKINNHHIILIGIIYAISDEIHQFYVPGRFFDIFDIILDTIGILIGFFLYIGLNHLVYRFKTSTQEKYHG